jgi:hypothetical protein
MDYLTAWYEAYRADIRGQRHTFLASDLLRLISPFKRGVQLNAQKLGHDLRNASFPVVKEHSRRGQRYTIVF